MFGFVNSRFTLGCLVVTYQADAVLTADDITRALEHHVECRWDELDDHDREMNEQALEYGGRILSQHWSVAREKFWIITEADRSVTTVLLPHEY